MMKKYKFIIEGDPKPKKNNPQLIGGKVPRMIPSKISMKYEREGIKQIKRQIDNDFKTIKTPCNVKTVFYRETKRRVDISNLINAIHDILTGAGIIEDDDWSVIESIDGSRVRYDKEDPRTEIEIAVYNDEDNTMVKQINDIEKKEKEEKERKRKEREERKRELMNRCYLLREEGNTFKKIGEEVGVSASTASKYYKEVKSMKDGK